MRGRSGDERAGIIGAGDVNLSGANLSYTAVFDEARRLDVGL
jgi:hypothetical protein